MPASVHHSSGRTYSREPCFTSTGPFVDQRASASRPHNTQISGEDRAVLAVAGFVSCISLLGGAPNLRTRLATTARLQLRPSCR
jgi:hypothetical protein